MREKKKIFAIAVLIVVFLLALLTISKSDTKKASQTKNTTVETLNNKGFTLAGLNSFVVKETFNPYFSDFPTESFSAERNNEILKVTILSEIVKDRAEAYTKDQFLLLNSLFDSKTPPYPEFITNKTGCSKEFLPIIKNEDTKKYYILYADKRFNYGLCSQDLVVYKAGLGIFYCESKEKLFKIEYFTDKNTSSEQIATFMNSFTCSNEL